MRTRYRGVSLIAAALIGSGLVPLGSVGAASAAKTTCASSVEGAAGVAESSTSCPARGSDIPGAAAITMRKTVPAARVPPGYVRIIKAGQWNCPLGSVCFWEHENFTGMGVAMPESQGDFRYLTTIDNESVDFNDKASSAFNNGKPENLDDVDMCSDAVIIVGQEVVLPKDCVFLGRGQAYASLRFPASHTAPPVDFNDVVSSVRWV